MKVWSKQKVDLLNKYNILLIVLTILCFILMFVLPIFLLIGIILIAFLFEIKRQTILRNQLDKDNLFMQRGYKKICNTIYLNEVENKVNILDKDYGFAQIIDCNLEVNTKTISSTTGNTKGRIKHKNMKKSKIKSKTLFTTTGRDVVTGVCLHITVEDFENPNIVVFVKSKDEGEKVEATLKVIISKNNEKYIETGTITKIEHKYITQENASVQIERLAQLHKDGVLTDYEFEMKKKELLDKVK